MLRLELKKEEETVFYLLPEGGNEEMELVKLLYSEYSGFTTVHIWDDYTIIDTLKLNELFNES